MRSFDSLTLQTPRLVLRPLQWNDASALRAIFSDPRVMRFWSEPPWTSEDQATTLIARDQAAMAEGSYLRFGIVRRQDDTLVGTCTLYGFHEQCRRAEVGYNLRSDVWGHGYMHEALTELIRYGFEELDLHRIEADIDPRNAASARSLDRLGFRREGLLRERWIVGDEVSDTALYGLLRSEWPGAPSPPT